MVSLIIPTYNRAPLLGRAIRSVLAQSFRNFELLIVDDSSSDNSEEVVRSFLDSRIRYVRHKTNCGAPAARNTGIRLSRGEYIAFLDSDDELLPDKIEVQLRKFQENPARLSNLGVVLGRRWLTNLRHIQTAKRRVAYRGYVYPLFFKDKAVRLGDFPTLMARKACLDDIGGFDEQFPASQFFDLCVRLASRYEFDTVDTLVEIYHDDSGPHLWTPANRAKAANLLLRKYKDGIPHRRYFHSRLRIYLGVTALQQGYINEARREIGRAFLLHPSLKALGYLLLSLAGNSAYRTLRKVKGQLESLGVPSSATRLTGR